MFSLPLRSVTGLAAVLMVFASAAGAAGQGPQKVRFDTADGVDIHGSWYGVARSGPVVMILHEIGSDSRRREWTKLALELQKAGYAVLTFDFRGHGQSTGVNGPLFARANPGIKINPGAIINVKDFKRSYYPTLINDIAAAKAFLDIKNDAGSCNSSSLIVIGAGEAATLGTVWIKSEWSRYPMMQIGFQQRINYNAPYGKNVVAGIWLSISHKIGTAEKGGRLIPPLLMKAAKIGNMPMVFLHNANDKNDKTFSKYCVDELKTKKNPKHKFIGELGIGNAGNLKGRQLLLAPNTTSGVVKWVDTLKNQAIIRNNWIQQDFPKTKSVWVLNGRPIVASTGLGQPSFQMMNFTSFIRSR